MAFLSLSAGVTAPRGEAVSCARLWFPLHDRFLACVCLCVGLAMDGPTV